ncbi:CHAT domain-containing protein [Streptosporangium sp. NBC_01469]|uniref:CHAT domain-containing protein n=1 Tax=Streptosporangium sp. NBC_01469 TaxID=2903898 RepID=UPI002E2B3F2F|nr:CHAT domain-containing protein [Streptosporangium sp. NBC_01469]
MRPDHGYLPDYAANLVSYAEQLMEVEDHAGAFAAAQEAVEVYEQLRGEPLELARALTVRAESAATLGRFRDAMADAPSALLILRDAVAETGSTPVLRDARLRALLLLADVQLRAGLAAEALTTAEAGIELLARSRSRRRASEARFAALKAEALRRLGRDGEATEVIEELDDSRRSPDEAVFSRESPDEAVAFYRGLAEHTPESALPALAAALAERRTRQRSQSDDKGALTTAREIVAVHRRLAEAEPDSYRIHLAYALAAQAEIERGVVADDDEDGLDRVTALLLEAAELLPIDHKDRAKFLVAAAVEQSPDTAISVLARLMSEQDGRATHSLFVYATLGDLLVDRSQRLGTAEDLERAIGVLREGLAVVPESEPERGVLWISLSGALRLRYERSKSLADLDESISLVRANLDLSGGATAPAELGLLLFHRFLAVGEQSDLDAAIELMRGVASAIPEDSADAPLIADRLADMLEARFERSGEPDDLRAYLTAAEEVLFGTSADAPEYPVALDRLRHAVSRTYEATREPAVLDRLLDLTRRLVGLDTPGTYGALALVQLGHALEERFERFDDPSDLEEAVEVGRRAVGAMPEGDPDRHWALALLAKVLLRRSWTAGIARDLDEADALIRLAAAIAPQQARRQHEEFLDTLREARFQLTRDLADLAAQHRGHWERSGDPAAFEGALEAFATIAGRLDKPIAERVLAWQEYGWLAMAGGAYERALGAFRAAIELVPLAMSDRLWHGRGQREDSLTELAGDAAACALEMGRPEEALTLLEQGRGLLLSQALGVQEDLRTLRAHTPELAERLSALRIAVDEPSSREPRVQEAEEFERLVEEVRALPDMAGFLRPPAVGDLLTAATEGPVVVLNVSGHRCDAIAVTTDGLLVIRLPGLDRAAATERARRFLTELTTAYRPLRDRLGREQSLAETLGWLWEVVVGPVLEALRPHLSATGGMPRVWWMPTGPLSVLPLHAAGWLPEISAINSVVSSYTATIGALTRARSATPVDGPDSALIVLPRHAESPMRMPGAEREALTIARLLAPAVVLEGEQATRQHLLRELPGANVLHFAGHSSTDADDATAGSLLLSDGPLRLRDMAAPTHLMYLSACATAAPGAAGEPINLAIAAQLSGSQQAIATLWEVNDRAYADLAQAFYEELAATDGTIDVNHSARALNAAARRLRERYPHIPSLWAAHIHVGR